jgi:hypothetical protein
MCDVVSRARIAFEAALCKLSGDDGEGAAPIITVKHILQAMLAVMSTVFPYQALEL